MNTAIHIFLNFFGATTMFLLLYGSTTIIMGGKFDIPEITFLMFASFVLTSLLSASMQADKEKEKEEKNEA